MDLVYRGRGRLYQGSAPPFGGALANAGIHTLVLCAEEFQPPADLYPGVHVIRCPIDDATDFRRDHLELARDTADIVRAHLRSGRRVLVTCRQGRNRSGLVNGLALARGGVSPARAIMSIRVARAPRWQALTNRTFVRIILSQTPQPLPPAVALAAAAQAPS